MKTTLHKYHFDLDTHEGVSGWAQLKERMRVAGNVMTEVRGMCHTSFSYAYALDGEEAEVKTDHLHHNQWTVNVRGVNFGLHEWLLEKVDNERIKMGYYLDLTDEMKTLRKDRYRCGWCGHQYVESKGMISVSEARYAALVDGDSLCMRCCGNDNATTDKFKLMKLDCVELDRPAKPELTEKQMEFLIGVSRDKFMQTLAPNERSRKEYRVSRDEYAERIAVMDWLHRNGMAHNSAYRTVPQNGEPRWKFGWMSPIPEHHLPQMHVNLLTFPAKYSIKVQPGDREVNDARDSYVNHVGKRIEVTE